MNQLDQTEASLTERLHQLELANQTLKTDLADRERAEADLTQRLITLTRPLENTADIKFEDLFNLAEIQRIQDAFAAATGVASVITDTSGRPLTRPSNFCYLCQNIIRQTEKGLANCYHSDAVLGQLNPLGPTLQPCLSGGLLDAGASICAGDQHIANWLIGQVLEEPINEAALIAYSREIGADEEAFRQALVGVTRMPKEQFARISEALFLVAEQLSRLALKNVQQARYITERQQAEAEIQRRATELSILYESGLAFTQLLDPTLIAHHIITVLANIDWHHAAVRLKRLESDELELLAFSQPDMPPQAEAGVRQRMNQLVGRVGQGMSGWVIQLGQSLRTGDLSRYPQYIETFPGIRSGLYAPLKVGDEVIGVIAIESEEADAFSQLDERFLTTLASQAAVAIHNARLLDETRRRVVELEAISSMSTALRAAPTRADMLPVIVQHTMNLLQGNSALIVMDQPATEELTVVATCGLWSPMMGVHLQRSSSIHGQVVTSGQPYLNADVRLDSRAAPDTHPTEAHAMACVPLIEQIETIGALSIGRSTPFSPRELRLLQAIADIAANALYRVSIVETLEQRVADRTRALVVSNDSLMQANTALQELDQLKSKFVSDVSHELRTPVTSLSLYIDLLQHGKPEKRDHYIAQLQGQMARLKVMINDILDLSRLERDRTQVALSPVEVNSIVEHVAAQYQVTAEAAGLQLRCVVADAVPPVLAQLEHLTRAVTNLVTNGLKYTRSGFVQMQTFTRADRVCVEVSDTGIGIAPDDLPHVFERFYRGKPVAQSAIPGTGLGLAIVKEIVEAHGGTVDVESAPGEGSVFRIWLPIPG